MVFNKDVGQTIHLIISFFINNYQYFVCENGTDVAAAKQSPVCAYSKAQDHSDALSKKVEAYTRKYLITSILLLVYIRISR